MGNTEPLFLRQKIDYICILILNVPNFTFYTYNWIILINFALRNRAKYIFIFQPTIDQFFNITSPNSKSNEIQIDFKLYQYNRESDINSNFDYIDTNASNTHAVLRDGHCNKKQI